MLLVAYVLENPVLPLPCFKALEQEPEAMEDRSFAGVSGTPKVSCCLDKNMWKNQVIFVGFVCVYGML